MFIIYLLTFLIFITIFTLSFFELSYFYSKKLFLQTAGETSSPLPKNTWKKLAQKLNYSENSFLIKIFTYDYLEQLLRQSGQPSNLTVKEFISLYKLLNHLTLPIALFIVVSANNLFTGLILGIIFWSIIIYLPIIHLRIIANRRVREFNYNFSAFIDMLALTVNAGMNFENALFFTADKFTGIIKKEFKYVQTEVSYGHSLNTALSNLQQRINSVDLKRFITAVKQATQLGTPLSEVLNIQSKLILTSRIQRAEELSRTASVKISIPLVFFIFPALLILYLVPAILQFMGV